MLLPGDGAATGGMLCDVVGGAEEVLTAGDIEEHRTRRGIHRLGGKCGLGGNNIRPAMRIINALGVYLKHVTVIILIQILQESLQNEKTQMRDIKFDFLDSFRSH